MNQHRLLFELDQVASRFRLLRFWQLLAAAWLVAALCGLVVWVLKYGTGGSWNAAVPLLALIAAVLAGVGIWQSTAWARDRAWVARRIEAAFPELHSCLLAAVEQRPALPGGRFGYLQSNVIHQALTHADRHEWREVVPMRRIATAALTNLATFALFLAVLLGIAFTIAPQSTAATIAGLTPSSLSGSAFSVTVEPGDTEVERGTSLLVLARVQGRMPPEAALVYQAEGAEEARLAMSSSLNDPVFGGRIPIVDAPLAYHVEMDDYKSPTYRVSVFEYPRLEKADAKLVFPSYTGQEPRLVQDVRTVSVVEGTELTLVCYLNKPVTMATLSEEKEQPIALTSVEGDKPAYQTMIHCDRTRKLKLELVDDAGRKNVKPVQFTINVLPNQPVALKPVFPARDLEVSALEELELKATAWDDFGVKRFGLSYSLSGQEPIDVVLGENAAAKQKHELAHAIRLEELKAQPDDLLSYHFWAEDFAPDGSVRRSESDMYFAEVRPFDEIFRQGEQPPGGQQQQQQGQGQNAQQAQQLGELQKQIINATWKVIRREIGSKLTDPFASDVEQIKLSQGSALEQAAALAERVQDPESQDHVATVLQAMQEAINRLTTAHDQPSPAPLQPALKAEQAAYQALLKLRAREHNVVRQNQRQSGRSSSSRSQQQRQQMQQLELRNDENRYETQRQAQDQNESAEERENRQVLNRLRELAQRQHDLNERLKELQSALEEARTEQQKEDLRRQLQRLQEEQRQILQDTEELQSRMESAENLERMAEERQQLQETREQVQRASEALEQTQITQAAASGTRAEQNFEDLRNEFRRRASGRFSEEMQQMREAARDLDQREQELSQRLQEAAQPQAQNQAKSLRDSGEREKIAEELTQQRQRLSGLEEQMRQTIQDAEQTEPLLAEKLYDAARTAQDQNVQRALEAAERSLRQGLTQDARQQEEPAARGISQLREGIDRAAEAVLGDETEALRRAREELQNLSRELNDEINRNDPSRQSAQGQAQRGQQQPGQTQSGEEQGQQQPGQQQPGESQEGQQQAGQKGQKGQKGGSAQNGEQDQKGRQGQKGEAGQKGQQGQQGGEGQKGQSGQQGQGQGQPQDGEQSGGAQAGDRQPGDRQQGQRRTGSRNLRDGEPQGDGSRQNQFDAGPGGGNERMIGPLAGEGFREWSDRLRDVEEMVADPELRAEAARIRERARSLRAEFRRHSNEPNWELAQQQIAGPLVELRDRVATELLRRTAKQAIIPLDRDPVPPKYTEKTRLYYERLGSGQ